MRLVKVLLAAGALAAIVAVPTRAQDYTKTTLFTFSQPVQLPGMTLPAGEYMFKLANPESGRRVIGVWDKDGQKFHGMALTVADESMRQAPPAQDAVVLFREAPAGEPQAVKSWFYSGDSIGYEFIYPHAQAVKIARASGITVLATAEGRNSEVGRVDSGGQFRATADAASPASTTSSAATASTTSTSTASTTTASSASTTTSAQASEPDANRPEPQTAAASTTTAQAAPSTTTAPQSDAAIVSPRPAPETVTARAATAPSEPRAVGTSGQADALPKTAGAGTLIQLSGFALLGAGAAIRSLRRRFAASA